jgi:hypothetical protein
VETEKALFKVIGMYCITCKPIVEKQLKDEEAIKDMIFQKYNMRLSTEDTYPISVIKEKRRRGKGTVIGQED